MARNDGGIKGGEEIRCEVGECWAVEEERGKDVWVEVIREDPWTREWVPLREMGMGTIKGDG